MKILLINGSQNTNGSCKRALLECESVIKGHGAEALYYEIGAEPRRACSGCGGCADRGRCIYGDIDSLTELVRDADAIIIAAPTHFGAAPGNLTAVISRLVYSARRYIKNKPAAIIATGRRGCLKGCADNLRVFFEFTCSPIVSGCYPSIIYSKDFKSASADLEGLQNLRSLTENTLYLAKCIEQGRKNGIKPPNEEERIKTDISSLTQD